MAAGVFLCAGAALAAGPRLNEKVFSIGFARIADTYIAPTDLSAIAVNGLNGLSAIDAALSASLEAGVIRLRAGDRVIAEFAAPALPDPDRWAGLTASALGRAAQESPPLAQASPERVYQAVFDAVTAKLDGYSRYSGANRATGERAVREGYGQVGLTLGAAQGDIVVSALPPGGEAHRAGVRIGDRIVSIDGVPAKGQTAAQLRERLRGPVGSESALVLARKKSTLAIRVRREWRAPSTVHLTVTDGIAQIRVDRFSAATASQLRDAVVHAEKASGASLAGLVLDLRGNPGGLLDQSIAAADLFIDHGRIVSTEGRHPESWQVWEAKADDIAAGLPMAVLIDDRSASSAEVLAAALQDSGRAIVVGATSYGKGSVQTVTRLPNSGELFLTWSRFFTPLGHSLSHQGVQPSVCTGSGETVEAVLEPFLRRTAVAMRADAAGQPRAACPARPGAPGFDLAVARRLLQDRTLYASAAASSAEAAVAQR
jgi:carboxyl-terminal processing protease